MPDEEEAAVVYEFKPHITEEGIDRLFLRLCRLREIRSPRIRVDCDKTFSKFSVTISINVEGEVSSGILTRVRDAVKAISGNYAAAHE